MHHVHQFAVLLTFALAGSLHAQTESPTEQVPPQGKVLFQSHGEPPDPQKQSPTPLDPVAAPATTQASGPEFTDADRAALTITAYALDARLAPANGKLAMRALVTLRNSSALSVTRLGLQVSSTLRWESATLVEGAKRTPLTLAQHLIDTDADHTGKSSEAILILPQPLAPGESVTVDTFYSGTIAQSAGRLERIGATAPQAAEADWDQIAAGATALRGFGNVLWYPVVSPQLFLGQGAELFQAIGRARLANETVSIKLHLAIEYQGDPPTAAYFCGRRQPLVAITDDPNAPVASGSGIATADFAAEAIGFRVPSLFVFERPETLLAPSPAAAASSSSSGAATVGELTGPPMLAVEAKNDGSLPRFSSAAESIAPLLVQWFGTPPLSALTVLDHAGQPFEDGPFVVAPVDVLAGSDAAAALAHGLAHAWVQTDQPWMDEGLAQFASLLYVEQQQGRDAAVAQLNDLLRPLVLVEPAVAATTAQPASTPLAVPAGQALTASPDEVYYRRKSAAVFWMLRGIVGDDALREALTAWRMQPVSHDAAEKQAVNFERLLEKTSGKNLAWFFHDWVLNDLGLPDLSIADVTPRELPAGANHANGWLVAVTVRNDGAAAAEVPIVIRAGTFSTTKRLLIPAFGQATDRVLVEAPPTQVVVNDGVTPEMRTSIHQRDLAVQPAQ